MPQLGEIRVNEKSQKFVWAACEGCGLERWELIVRGKARNKLCRICNIKKCQPLIWAGCKKRPKRIGDIAKKMIEKLIRKGVIKRCPCSVCGEDRGLAHHPDYLKPLEIIWLCQKHHTEVHRSLKV